jgi:asparagine synthase (glutamine-hydrolysing)
MGAILESVAKRGIDPRLPDLYGIFGIALRDRQTRTLDLVGDRLGIKPMFYTIESNELRFASELMAFSGAGFPR